MNYHKLIRLHGGKGRLLTVAVGLLCVATAHAQSGGGYELKDAAFTSGSGAATNGAYRLTATFSPSVPNTATNGAYSLTASFASIVVVETPGAPPLKITGTGAGVVLSWPAPATGFKLQSAATLTPPNWTDVGLPVVDVGADRTVTVPLAAGLSQFYRLFKP